MGKDGVSDKLRGVRLSARGAAFEVVSIALFVCHIPEKKQYYCLTRKLGLYSTYRSKTIIDRYNLVECSVPDPDSGVQRHPPLLKGDQ